MKKIFTLAAAVLFATGMWGELTAHQPGTYEKAVNQGGYGATLVTFSERQYEVYGFSYNSSGSKPQILWAGTSTADASASQVLCSNLSSGVQEIAGWISMSTSGKSSTYNMPENTEFAASSVGSAGLYQMKMQGHTMTLKIKGYDQFSFLGNDNNGDKSKGKYLQVTINGVDSTKDLSSSTTIRRWSLNPSTEYTIAIQGLNTSNEHIDAFSLRIPLPSCTDPEFTVSPTEGTGFVGDPIDIAVTSKNQSKPINPAVTVDGVPGVYGTDYTFSVSTGLVQATPLKAGTFVVTFSQASNGTYCDAEESATFVISEKTPVTAVTIDGPAEGIIGAELVYTATAAGATAYEWYLDDVKQGSDSAKFIYTAVKGNHSIVCKARNNFNEAEEWIASDAKEVVVTKVCGELIKATLKGGTSADMSGAVGGTFDTNLGSGKYKLDKGKYIGIKLASGSFIVGDTVIITMSAAGQNYPCLFGDKDRNNCLYLATEASTATEYKIVLPAKANGLTSLYLSRGDDTDAYKWNPTVSSISVKRSCEASNNANISRVTVNGEEVAENEGTFEYTLSSSYEEENVTVTFELEHPLAHADFGLTSPIILVTPAAGGSAIQSIKVIAEDGTTIKVYTVKVNKSAGLSTDATLKALEVEGYTLTPAFDAEVTAYTITKAYGAENPAVEKVTATPNDGGAKGAEVVLAGDVYTITVTAEDNTTTKEYTITVNEAAARKSLLRATFSNGVHGFIAAGNIQVPYLAGEAEPTFVSATFWQKDGDPTAAVEEGKLVVTGADGLKDEYTLEFVALTPKAVSYEEETFTAVPSYIFSVYGWDDTKGVKFSKDVEEASNHRISEGKDRIYIALPAAKEVKLTAGVSDRPIEVTVNGVVDSSITKTGNITISLNHTQSNLIGIESNGSNGDAGFTKLQLVEYVPTALDNTEATVKATKRIVNGQLFIEKNGVMYNAQGAVVR